MNPKDNSLDSKIEKILMNHGEYDKLHFDTQRIKELILSERAEADRLGRIDELTNKCGKAISNDYLLFRLPILETITKQSNGGN